MNGEIGFYVCAFTDFFQVSYRTSQTAALMRHQRQNIFAVEVKLFDKRKYSHGVRFPPAWATNENVFILSNTVKTVFQLWAGVAVKFRSCFLCADVIICRIFRFGIHFKQFAADGFLNEFGANLRIALGKFFNPAVDVIFAFSGIVNYQILTVRTAALSAPKRSPAKRRISVLAVLATLTVHTLQFTLTCVQAQSGTATKLYAEALRAA